jgi:hypothetical protein
VTQKWYCEWNHPQLTNGIHHITEVGGVELHTCDVAFDPKRCGDRMNRPSLAVAVTVAEASEASQSERTARTARDSDRMSGTGWSQRH